MAAHGYLASPNRWTKPGSERRDFRILSFARHFELLDWPIGTGAYLDDMASGSMSICHSSPKVPTRGAVISVRPRIFEAVLTDQTKERFTGCAPALPPRCSSYKTDRGEVTRPRSGVRAPL